MILILAGTMKPSRVNSYTTSSSSSSSVLLQKSPTSDLKKYELFSVAPMMAHTNNHYRFFLRQLTQGAHLYTEMIPASQIVLAYEQALREVSPRSLSVGTEAFHPDQIRQVVDECRSSSSSRLEGSQLDELLRHHESSGMANNVHLQLGGRDPETLGKAAAIGTAFGYTSVNLNCGCPSNSVSSERQTGAALMKEPELVQKCVEQMHESVLSVNSNAYVSVKHRLGIDTFGNYDAVWDRQQSDEQAYQSCSEFVRIVSQGGHVKRFQVHARIGLLGDEDIVSSILNDKAKGMDAHNDPNDRSGTQRKKIDHSRVQYMVKKKAREQTMQNRSVPPLRSNVVNEIAKTFPQLEFVNNGGITSVEQSLERIKMTQEDSSNDDALPIGTMVGRAVINHPCAFSNVDQSIYNFNRDKETSRKKILERYIDYCQEEEERMKRLGYDSAALLKARRKLVGAPFHLFVGEEGNNAYQRRLTKLAGRAQRYSSHGMLIAALADVPLHVQEKPACDFVPYHELPKYAFAAKRSGPLQKSIY